MAKAFKCDVCNKYYGGFSCTIEFYNNLGFMIKQADVCKTCCETLANMTNVETNNSEKEVDEK